MRDLYFAVEQALDALEASGGRRRELPLGLGVEVDALEGRLRAVHRRMRSLEPRVVTGPGRGRFVSGR
jgi:hypothetical protein